jgi:Leucine-rich repeat (LRR) protein
MVLSASKETTAAWQVISVCQGGSLGGIKHRQSPFNTWRISLTSLCKGYIFSSVLLSGAVFNLAWLPVAQAATNCTAVVEISQEECEALVALYNTTGGPNWSDSSNNSWNVTDTPCSWTGVTCSGEHVTKIDRNYKKLNGSIPTELENLSQLTWLDLSYNYDSQQDAGGLTGQIPIELGNLSELTMLNLWSNQLSGPIPTELGNFSQLKKLYLGDNQLSGSIPKELGNLSLTTLELRRNQLTGSIPKELGNLTLLRYLYLDGNQLSGQIPIELGNLIQLGVLDLDGNQLSDQIPFELGHLRQLTELYLGGNQLSGFIPIELGNLIYLTVLELDDNQLSGLIPSELGILSQLEVLRLNNNQLSGEIPPSLICDECYTKGLDLGYNQLIAYDEELISFLGTKDPDWAETQNVANPTPSNPTPNNPTPSNPTPSNPTPSNPTPSNPTPSNPTPSNPTPSNPTPSNPTPSNPTPSNSGTAPDIRICPATGIIEGMCSNKGQVMTDATLESNANIARGELAGTINNQGIISQVTIRPNAVITGGKFTGRIKNEGRLIDIEFVGGSMEGGMLEGEIINKSKVGGFFKDIMLAENTHLIGGKVKGEITGDCEAPALLEELTIKDNSYVECVILGEGVILGEEVTLVNVFPILGEALALNAQGESFNSLFAGGVSVNEGPFSPSATISTDDMVEIRGYIMLDPEHVEQVTEVLVSARYKQLASPESEPPLYLILDTNNKVLLWNGDLANLVPFKIVDEPILTLNVPVYEGPLEAATLNIFFGYQLQDDTLVYSVKTIDITVTE